MKITDIIISAILKKGIMYEARNVDINTDIPMEAGIIKVNFKCDHMSIKIEKGDNNSEK